MSTEIEKATAEAIREIKKSAEKAESDAYLAVQKKSAEWAKVSAGFILLAIGVLTFFGFREVFEFEKSLAKLTADATEKADELDGRVAAIELKIEQVNTLLDASLKKNVEARQEFDKWIELKNELQESLVDAQNMIDDSRRTFRETQDEHAEIDRMLKGVETAQNSLFEIYLMYPGDYDDLAMLTNRLQRAGFDISEEHYLNYSVEKTEVVYFDRTEVASAQVNAVVGYVEEVLVELGRTEQVEVKQSGTRHAPQEIMIRIAPE